MLRISTDSADGRTTVRIEGKLCGAAALELASCWESAASSATSVTVDLSGVTFVDDEARALLAKMHARGAHLIASGCANRRLIYEISGREPEPCG